MFKREVFEDKDLEDDEISILVNLTQEIYHRVELELKLAGFWKSIPARNKLKSEIQRILCPKPIQNFLICFKTGHTSLVV